MQTERLLEIVQSRGLSVDCKEGLIRGVRILGPVSSNGRRYLAEAIRSGRGLYEGKVVNLNHPRRDEPIAERAVADRIGWLKNVQEADGGLSGDLHLLVSHPLAGAILEAAEKNPALFGLSHNAEGRTRRENGVTVVEEILKVRSVDLVSEPATTKSLFEQRSSQPMKLTINEILRRIGPEVWGAKLLQEAIDGGVVSPELPAEVEPAPEEDPEAAIKAAFRAAVMAAFDDTSLDMQATLAKIKEILKAQEAVSDKKDAGEKAKGEEGDDEEKKQTAEGSVLNKILQGQQRLQEQLTELKGRVGVERPLSGQHFHESRDECEVPKDHQEFCRRVFS